MADKYQETVQQRPPWIDDATVKNCKSCNKEFGVFTRKHHCRRCGDIFCDSCSNTYVELAPEMCYPEPQRVCSRCFREASQELKTRDECVDAAVSSVKFFLRSHGRILPAIYMGKRNSATKVTLLVENDEKTLHVLTVATFNKHYTGTSDNFIKILQTISHPHIHPTAEIGAVEGDKVAILRKFSSVGSLRDIIHGSQPRQNYAVKYQSRGQNSRALSDKDIATYGSFILEALTYLQVHGLPPFNIHCGNVIVFRDRICITDIENTLLDAPALLAKNKVNTSAIMFGRLLVEMATGKLVQSLDDISTAAASGALALSLPVLQVINTIANQTKGEEEFSFKEIITLPFFSQYARPSSSEADTFNYDLRVLVQKYLFSTSKNDPAKLKNIEDKLEKDEDYYQMEIALLTQLRKFKMFCVQPHIYKNEVVLTGVVFASLEEQIDKVVQALITTAQKPINTSPLKYASMDELLCYSSEHGTLPQIKEFFKPNNFTQIMKNIVNYMTIALLHKQEDLATLYLDSITQKFPDHLKQMTLDKSKLADLSNLIVLSAQNGMHKFLANFLNQLPELVNSRNMAGVSAVHAAAQSGNLATLRLLIEKYKADADCRDKNGWTPLHFAAQNGNNDMVDFLAKHCDIGATSNNRETALDLAYARQASNRKLIRALTLVASSSNRACVINAKLPSNLLMRVFANFNHKQILTLCLTCKSWRAIMNDENLLRIWFLKAFQGFRTLPSQIGTWKELLVRQVGGDNYSNGLNKLSIPNITVNIQKSSYIPPFEKGGEAELVNFLQKTFDITCALQKKRKTEIEETMKNQFHYHTKDINTTSSDAATVQSFIRIFEPDGLFFLGNTTVKRSKYLVMIGASWIFKRVGIVYSKDVS